MLAFIGFGEDKARHLLLAPPATSRKATPSGVGHDGANAVKLRDFKLARRRARMPARERPLGSSGA